jgi:hypothetical protein
MGTCRFQLALSLDGFVAGPDQSEENPLGVRGLELHQWVFPLEVWRRQQGQEGGEVNASTPVIEEAQANVGATVMGRNMFGGGPGPWPEDPPWNGWWGDNPPLGDELTRGWSTEADHPARDAYSVDASARRGWPVGGTSAWRWTIFHSPSSRR